MKRVTREEARIKFEAYGWRSPLFAVTYLTSEGPREVVCAGWHDFATLWERDCIGWEAKHERGAPMIREVG